MILLHHGRNSCCISGVALVSVLLQLSSFAFGFLAPRCCRFQNVKAVPPSRKFLESVGNCQDQGENYDDDDDDDDDDSTIKPYRNRSLAWTLKYRIANPYETARKRVLGFGHRSKDDWDDAMSSGQLGQYVPNHPDEMYAPEWISWDEWLGVMRTYNETKHLAANVLGLTSLDDYILFVRSDSKRAEGLRIPVRPDLRYKDEWIDEDSFFGKS
mmetsp:Transcript_18029/g.32224  ORF Transcript_18029/g.32224 Transcript_18029/m.32224 type:complete len:213 (-) Transcript_18029:333-971(-)